MKTVLVLFDSLNRLALSPYAEGVDTPAFDRLAARALTFDRHYVGSLPCMPARRDLHTGRLSFFHRSWGPLEPFDSSLPECLRAAGIYTHLATDHYHYWEDGGATYHNRYDSYDFVRGQERDPWHAIVDPPFERWAEAYHPKQYSERRGDTFYHYMSNRERIEGEDDLPCFQTFAAGLRFLETNHRSDNWLLQIETFDPHEPFLAPGADIEAAGGDMAGPIFDWPPYARVSETPAEVESLKAHYRASVRFCDRQLGRLLDFFDTHDLWADTALIVTTDHGFLLGEHDWWAKNRMYAYEEISHIPLFIHHPDAAGRDGRRHGGLTQAIDLMPTLLDVHGVDCPKEVTGRSLKPALMGSGTVREHATFGYFGGGVNITDGRFTHFLFPDDLDAGPLFQYTVMPTHMTSMFSPEELRAAEFGPAFDFTKGVRVLKVPMIPGSKAYHWHGPGKMVDRKSVLFDLERDPGQVAPVSDPGTIERLTAMVEREMRRHDAPAEVLQRFGFSP